MKVLQKYEGIPSNGELEAIFAEGCKVAVKVKETTVVDLISNLELPEEVSESDVTSAEMQSGWVISGDEISCLEGCEFIAEKVDVELMTYLVVKPFVGEAFSEIEVYVGLAEECVDIFSLEKVQ